MSSFPPKRMSFSPFTFFRGAARIMAHDLSRTPMSPLTHQWICGDAHLCEKFFCLFVSSLFLLLFVCFFHVSSSSPSFSLGNFGMFGSRERTLVFDMNDFDEAAIGPFEWDVKRLAASFIIAGQNNGFTPEECDSSVLELMRTYRESVHSFSKMSGLELFYKQLPVESCMEILQFSDGEKQKKKKDKKSDEDKEKKKKNKNKNKNDSDDEDDDKKNKKKKKDSDDEDDGKKKKKKSKKNLEDSDDEDDGKKKKKNSKKNLKDSDDEHDGKKKKKNSKKNLEDSDDEDDGKKKKKKKDKKSGSDDEKKKKDKDRKKMGVSSLNAPNGLPWSERMVEKTKNSDHQKAFGQLVDRRVKKKKTNVMLFF